MRPINLARLSPRRAYAVGLMRAKRQSRKELRALAQSFDDELVALQHDFYELALAHRRQCEAAAVSEALLQRAIDPDALLH